MRALHILSAVVLGFELPVPVYWFILHARVNFWRRHVRTGYWVAVIGAWGVCDWALYHFRATLFHGAAFPAGPLFGAGTALIVMRLVGAALIALDLFTLTSVELELGGSRLVGHAELTGKGQLATRGLYTRVRHPRYLGMITGVLGGCLLVGTQSMWIVGAAWLALTFCMIRLEEHELRLRFGSAYAEYSRRVPALLPFRIKSRDRYVSAK
jgi:protein-S-isoprenylcysteine O-methyltransferase Ste14